MKKTLVLCQNLGSATVLKEICQQMFQEKRAFDFIYIGRSNEVFLELQKRFNNLPIEMIKLTIPSDQAPLETPPIKGRVKKILAYQNYRAGLEATGKIRPRAQNYLDSGKFPSLLKFNLSRTKKIYAHQNTWPLHEIVAKNLSYYSDFLTKNSYTSIVTCADGVNGPIELLSMAKILGVTIVMVPYGFPLKIDLEISLNEKKDKGKLITIEDKYGDLLKIRYPHWVKQGQNSGSLMFSPEYICILESFGISLDNPWMISGNLADLFCCEGKENKKHYLEEGIEEEKVQDVGSPYSDIVYRSLSTNKELKSAFENSTPIHQSKTFLLVSWPTSYHEKYKGQSEFVSYAEMTNTFFNTLAEVQNLELLVSCHPAMSKEEVEIIKQTGAKVSDDNLIELIPQHDIFCSFFSSTTRWALACGKLVANYDMYQLNLDIYDEAPGFFRSEKIKELASFVKSIAESHEKRDSFLKKQALNRNLWTEIDGLATERITQLL